MLAPETLKFLFNYEQNLVKANEVLQFSTCINYLFNISNLIKNIKLKIKILNILFVLI